MKLRPPPTSSDEKALALRRRQRRARGAAFTLAEVLAAMAFLAILIPVIAECLTIASRAS